MFFGNKERDTIILEVTTGILKRELPVVREEASLEEIVEAMVRSGHSRLLYVVDGGGRLMGAISLGDLIRHVFSRSHEPQIHPRRLMGSITLETAGHMMQKKPVFAREDEKLGEVLKRMIKSNVKEIPIVDDEKRVTGDITMLDLLRFMSAGKKTS